MRRRVPFRVTVLVWAVLSFTAWNALRLWTAIAWSARLAEFAPRPGPLYTGASGAIWTTAGLAVLWSLWKGKPWAPRLVVGAGVAYSLWYWIDRLLLQERHANWPFVLAANLLLLIHVFFTIHSRYFQREAYEREPEN